MITHTNSINSIPTEEQETVINYSRMEKAVSIFTSDQTVITRLDKLCESSPEFQVEEITISKVTNRALSKKYKITEKRLISFRSGIFTKELSEEEREKRREIMKRIIMEKNNN